MCKLFIFDRILDIITLSEKTPKKYCSVSWVVEYTDSIPAEG